MKNFKILLILLFITYISAIFLNTGCSKFEEVCFVIFIIVSGSYCFGAVYPAKGIKRDNKEI